MIERQKWLCGIDFDYMINNRNLKALRSVVPVISYNFIRQLVQLPLSH